MSYSCRTVVLVRADRLLRILLLLQTRGRLTAGELAAELEVSVRTVQRDMDALSGAGVPVYAVRGGDGGWQLIDGFKSDLTGLTPAEALAVAVSRPDTVLRDLGLDDGAELGMLKVLAALPALSQQAAEHARQRVHVDLEPWDGSPAPNAEVLRDLYRATSTDAVIGMRYGTRRERFDVEPLGLVAKGMVWYLVARRGSELRTYRTTRIRDVVVRDAHFERPPDFDLADHWRAACRRLARTYPTYDVTLRVTDAGLRRLRWTSGTPIAAEETSDGWHRVTADLENEEEATAAVLSLGADVIVESPTSLRAAVAEQARTLVANATRERRRRRGASR